MARNITVGFEFNGLQELGKRDITELDIPTDIMVPGCTNIQRSVRIWLWSKHGNLTSGLPVEDSDDAVLAQLARRPNV
jgi:hypothetical protein